MIVLKETQKQKNEKRAIRAVNTQGQYKIYDFTYAKYGVIR